MKRTPKKKRNSKVKKTSKMETTQKIKMKVIFFCGWSYFTHGQSNIAVVYAILFWYWYFQKHKLTTEQQHIQREWRRRRWCKHTSRYREQRRSWPWGCSASRSRTWRPRWAGWSWPWSPSQGSPQEEGRATTMPRSRTALQGMLFYFLSRSDFIYLSLYQWA